MQLKQLLQRGIELQKAGRLEEAKAAYQRARALVPKSFDATFLLGAVAHQQGDIARAVDLLRKARALNPRAPACAARLGLALIAAGRAEEAECALRDAVGLKPDYAEAWNHLGYCLSVRDRLDEAVACYERATQLDPHKAAFWHNQGLALSMSGRAFDALRCHERARQADPSYAKAHFGRAQALQQLNEIEAAVAAYDEFLRLEPDHLDARSYRLFALNNLPLFTRAELFAEHVEFGRRAGAARVRHFAGAPLPDRRLRVALLSPDLREHSCSYFLEPLLRHLEPADFELFLYHDHFRTDAVSDRFKAMASIWRNFVGQSAAQVEAAILDDKPDILIDLAGHTGISNRLSLFARRLAPVQISYLGYPNTTGVAAMDFRFTDAIADPPGEADSFATERLTRFSTTAWAYQPPASTPDVTPPPSTLGPSRGITFGCFNNLGKVTDETLRTWSQLLASVPGSRLMLKGRGMDVPAQRDRFTARLSRCGIEPERVVLHARTASTAEHLALYREIDIALDTFPYNGTTTTCEALWMGVPVVSQCGDRHAARVGASLLEAVGHEEWIAPDEAAYLRIARSLADSGAQLREIRASLRGQLARSTVMDHAGQAARFGAALRTCWRSYCASVASHETREPALAAVGAAS